MTKGLDRLFTTIAARKGDDPTRSYTAKLLLAGVEQCAKKFGEEAVETVIAAVNKDRHELAEIGRPSLSLGGAMGGKRAYA